MTFNPTRGKCLPLLSPPLSFVQYCQIGDRLAMAQGLKKDNCSCNCWILSNITLLIIILRCRDVSKPSANVFATVMHIAIMVMVGVKRHFNRGRKIASQGCSAALRTQTVGSDSTNNGWKIVTCGQSLANSPSKTLISIVGTEVLRTSQMLTLNPKFRLTFKSAGVVWHLYSYVKWCNSYIIRDTTSL